jgi:hypothetical protein
MEDIQNYYITPPTIFLPEDGLKIAFIGTDNEWVEELTDDLETTFTSIPMTFYHLEPNTSDNWQWLYMMAEQADLIMINAGKATNLELMISTMHLGNKTWFYIDPEVVDKNLRILLNTINANMFNDSEQLHNMLKAFLGNG